jgi:multidrug transporter EmrE-like cation transporter
MSLMGFFFLVLAALLTAVGNLLLRHGALHLPPFQPDLNYLKSASQNASILIGIALYGSALIPWLKVLSIEQLSVSYPILVGITFILVTWGAYHFYSEDLSIQKSLGIVGIAAGIILIAKS